MTSAHDEPVYRQRFSRVVARADETIDLLEAGLLIACEAYPDLDVDSYRRRLEGWGEDARQRMSRLAPGARVDALNEFLFGELEFRGNEDDYYDPRNSYLNEVLDRRLGIPISLSAVYIEIGRRVGLDVSGVGLPGHFITKISLAGEDLLVDPFHGGVLLSAADCQRRLDRIFDGKLRMEPEMLASCGPRQMLARMLQNLKSIYARRENHLRTLGVVELLLLVEPDDTDELRDRGLLYAALDCYGLAVQDLTTYLARVPEAPEAGDLIPKIAFLQEQATRVN